MVFFKIAKVAMSGERGKENGIYILQSIDHGPFELGTTKDTLGTTPKGSVFLIPERPRKYDDLNDNEKKRFDVDVRATNIVLQGLPKDNDFRQSGNGGAQIRARNVNAGQGKPIKCFNYNGLRHIAWNCTQPKRQQNSDYFKDKMLLMQAQENGAVLDEEELLFLTREQTNNFDADVDDHTVKDLALNDDNIFQAYECDAFDSDVDDKPTAQSIFMANLSSAGLTNQQADPSNASILSEVHDIENAIDLCDDNQDEHEIHNEVQQKNIIKSTRDHMGNSNVTPYKQYLSVNDVFVVPSCASSISNDAYVLHDNDAYVPHDPLVTKLNIYKEQVSIYEQCARITQMGITCKTTSLQNEIKNLKTQLKGKMPCVTSNDATPKVPACAKYAIDVQPIPPRQRNNRFVHHGYLNRLKDTLDTLREVVEEARSKRPSDNILDYACVYTKRSQELLENMSASCPKADNKQDTIIATKHVTRKKYVTFAEPLETSSNNLPKIVKQQIVQKTNILILHSTGVRNATKARRSQPKSNTMHDKTLPANSVPKKKVKYHPKKNKSKLSKKNRVYLSTSIRRTVFNTNSNSLCKICNECISSVNHDQCVDNFLKSSNTPPVRTMWRVKQKTHIFVRDLDGVNLIEGIRGSNLYIISVEYVMSINDLARKDLVRGLPRLKFEKNHMCSACQLRKSMKATHQPKMINTIMEVLHTLHMDLCGPLRVQSINGKKYILVIVDDYSSPGPTPNLLTPGSISLGLVPNPARAIPYVPPTKKELEILFQLMFDEYFEPSSVDQQVPPATAVRIPVNPLFLSVSISVDQDAPSEGLSPSSLDHQSSSIQHGVAADHSLEVNPFAPTDNEPFVNIFAPNPTSEVSSSRETSIANSN
uniref:Integrase, catalytic region, zinc finger, CCHC-type, peptidase aspartic, catalytic n=1 Tax=Tanacetum cinerariifolium TaxID=118510 RepID=A0A6L2LDZ8_TANCI|nr:hypothetical protein [Tanacetum cinerariifolium]